MKYWLLTFLVIATCAGSLTWLIRRKIIPRFLASANEEMVADWHAALTECHQETGTWPDPADSKAFGEQLYIVMGADGRRIEGGYLQGRANNSRAGVIYDVYDQPMRIRYAGDTVSVASAGPDRAWDTADDVTSDRVKERYTPSTLATARAEAAARAAKKKK